MGSLSQLILVFESAGGCVQLRRKWPVFHWDIWLRREAQHKNRDVIIPEVSPMSFAAISSPYSWLLLILCTTILFSCRCHGFFMLELRAVLWGQSFTKSSLPALPAIWMTRFDGLRIQVGVKWSREDSS
jgi:hypothetical protein